MLDTQKIRISIVIVTYNNLKYTRSCIESIICYSEVSNYEIIIVDNFSTDLTKSYLKTLVDFDCIKIIENESNLGFAKANNIGILNCTGDYIVLLNNDTVVTRHWMLGMLSHFERHESLGIVCPVTNNIGNEAKIKTAYKNLNDMHLFAEQTSIENRDELCLTSTVAFFCVMIPKKVIDAVGLLSEDYEIGFFEDDDYCRRLERAHFQIGIAKDVFVHHALSASFNLIGRQKKKKLFDANKKIYEQKWGKWTPHHYRK